MTFGEKNQISYFCFDVAWFLAFPDAFKLIPQSQCNISHLDDLCGWGRVYDS